MDPEPSEHVVGEGDHRLRLDRFLHRVRPDLGRHRIDRLLRTGAVRVGGRARDGRHFVKRGDRVTVRPRQEPSAAASAPREILRTPHLLAAGKPPGWTTNPVAAGGESLLAWARTAAGPSRHPGIVHRIDRQASGLVLLSLTPEGHRRLRRAFRERTLEKVYLARVAGRVTRREFTIDLALARDGAGRMRPTPDGPAALTECRALHAGRDASLLEVRPRTGRLHQIRAHLAAIGHPVLGDPRYGAPSRAGDAPRLWLHAWRIGLPPRLAAALGAPREIECPLWEDLAAVGSAYRLPPLRTAATLRAAEDQAMPDIAIADALQGRVPPGTRVTVKGWVRTRRDSKAGVSFIHLSDGSCFAPLQIVAASTLPNYATEVQNLSAGCAVVATGELKPSPAKGQAIEMHADEVRVIGWVEDPETYPVSPKPHTFEYLRTVAHLRPRTNTFGAVARVRDCLAQAVHRFHRERGFYWIHTPIITASDAEGAGQMFRVSTLDLVNLPRTPEGKVDFAEDFFGRPTFLTVSGQLAVENYCLALTKVYTFGPTFRAENSNTSRHLSEFWMIEPEIAFADLAADAQLAEDFLKYIFRAVLEERADDMAFFAERIEKTAVRRLEEFVAASFERLTYTEAVRALERSGKSFEFPVRWGMDLQSEHERYLTEELVGRPVVVVDYPKEIKAFYMRLNDDERTVAAMDVLAPGIGEIIGGSQREERLEVLDRRIAELGLEKDAYWWYRDLRRYGTVPHAGFGLGFDRTVVYVTGMANIRDVIPFPRTPKSADF